MCINFHKEVNKRRVLICVKLDGALITVNAGHLNGPHFGYEAEEEGPPPL